MPIATSLEIRFYQSLGKLFYAIAASDKVVRETEVETLIKLVKSEWVPMDDFEDEYHVDAAYQIETVFDWLDFEGGLTVDSCFDEFKLFKKENEPLFTKKRKQLIWKTCNAIANSFSGKNKSEIIMLARLKIVLEELNVNF